MRVLIVEDEPVIALEIESLVLERLPDAEIVVAASVCEAQTAIAEPVALALLDIDVTDGKTYPLALQLQLKKVPFAFVSGADRSDAPQELCDAFQVMKPFSPTDIHERLDVLRDAAQAGAGRQVSAAPPPPGLQAGASFEKP
jgi:DNA-binding response OmpR family regulator